MPFSSSLHVMDAQGYPDYIIDEFCAFPVATAGLQLKQEQLCTQKASCNADVQSLAAKSSLHRACT